MIKSSNAINASINSDINISAELVENSLVAEVNLTESTLSATLDSENMLTAKITPKPEINVSILGGARGKTGLSTYELWLSLGNQGTLEEFLEGLKGRDGGDFIHPNTHSASMIEETEDRLFLTPEERVKILMASSTFVHDQILSKDKWIIEHNLEKFPSVSIVDSSGRLVMGDIEYLTYNKLMVSFTAEFSGKAYLN